MINVQRAHTLSIRGVKHVKRSSALLLTREEEAEAAVTVEVTILQRLHKVDQRTTDITQNFILLYAVDFG